MTNKIIILILDSGFPNHRDISDIIKNKSINFFSSEYHNLFKDKKYPYKGNIIKYDIESIDDLYDHQTNIIGIINSKKIGISKNSNIIVGKILNKHGFGTMDQILKGLEYANEINPNIVNISTGYGLNEKTSQPEILLHNKIKSEITKLFKKNIIVICACGNNNKEMFYPAKFTETISVSIYYNPFPEADYICNIEHFVTTSKNIDYDIKKGSSFATAYITGILSNYIYNKLSINLNKIKIDLNTIINKNN
jgi:hypothetical protein